MSHVEGETLGERSPPVRVVELAFRAGEGDRPLPGARRVAPLRSRRSARGGARSRIRRATRAATRAARVARRTQSTFVPYVGWSAGFTFFTLANLVVWLTGNRPNGPTDIVRLAAIAALPMVPIVGFHLSQALRQFRTGHSLADLRVALQIAQRDRTENEALVRDDEEDRTHRARRIGIVDSVPQSDRAQLASCSPFPSLVGRGSATATTSNTDRRHHRRALRHETDRPHHRLRSRSKDPPPAHHPTTAPKCSQSESQPHKHRIAVTLRTPHTCRHGEQRAAVLTAPHARTPRHAVHRNSFARKVTP